MLSLMLDDGHLCNNNEGGGGERKTFNDVESLRLTHYCTTTVLYNMDMYLQYLYGTTVGK